MPTVLRDGPYRFFFYSNERDEPPHIHVEYDGSEAKFWLDPVKLARSRRFATHRLAQVQSKVEKNRTEFLKDWHDHFRS